MTPSRDTKLRPHSSPYGVRQPPALKIWRWCRRRFCRSPFTSPSPHLANALFFVRAALFLFLCLPVVRIRPPFPYLSGARLISFHLQHACTLADELRSAFTATVVDGDERIHVTSPLQPSTLQDNWTAATDRITCITFATPGFLHPVALPAGESPLPPLAYGWGLPKPDQRVEGFVLLPSATCHGGILDSPLALPYLL